jgi:4-hydroxy-tetrahydrodipicolinate synthase
VASNLIPGVMVELVREAAAGNWNRAREIHLAHHRLMSDMFLDTNPIPVKSAMAMLKLCREFYRLPLCEMNDNLKQRLHATMHDAGVI